MKSRGVPPILAALVAIYLIALPAHAASRLAAIPARQEARLLSSAIVLSWSDPEQLPMPDLSDNAYNPAIAIDPQTGNAHAAWEEGGRIYYAMRDHQDWHIDSDLILAGDSPSLALDASGAPHIVYVDISLSDNQLQIFHCAWNGQEWTLPSIVSGTSGPSTSPDIRIVSESQTVDELPINTIHVVWASRVNGDNALFHAQSTDNGEMWHSVLPIPNARGYAPRLAVAPDGGLWTAWRSELTNSEDRTSDILVSHWDGASWWPVENLSGALGHDSASPSVACPRGDIIYVTWEEQLLGGGSVIYVGSGQSGDWSEPRALSVADGYEPAIASDTAGNIHLAWDGGATVKFTWQPVDGPWQPIVQLSEAPRGLGDIELARERADLVSLMWSAETAENGRRLVFQQSNIEAQATETPTQIITIPPPSATPSQTATRLPTATETAISTITPTEPPSLTTTATATEILPPTATATLVATITVTSTAVLTETATPPIPGTATVTCTPSATSIATAAPTVTSSPTDNGGVTSTSTPGTMVPTIPNLAHMSVPLVLKVVTGSAPEPLVHQREGLPGGPAYNHPETRDRGQSDATVAPPTWTEITNISASSVTSQEITVVASNDRVFAVWVEEDPWGYKELCYSIYAEESWSSPTCFYAGEEPAMAVSSDGRVHLTYSNEFAGNYDVYYSYWNGSGWALPVNISQTSGTSIQPAIACKSDNKPLIVWTDTTEGTTRIYHAWLSSGLWNTYLIPSSAEGSDPTIAVNGNDVVWVAWQATDIGDFYEIYAIYGDGVAWNGFSIDASGSGGIDSVAPRIIARGTQAISMAWQEGNGFAGEIFYSSNESYYPWWCTPENLSQNVSHSQAPDLVSTADDAGFVAWDEEAIVSMRTQLISQSPWLVGVEVVSSPDAPGEVRVAADARFGIHFLWSQDGSNGARDIYHRAMAWQLRQPVLLPLVMAP